MLGGVRGRGWSWVVVGGRVWSVCGVGRWLWRCLEVDGGVEVWICGLVDLLVGGFFGSFGLLLVWISWEHV